MQNRIYGIIIIALALTAAVIFKVSYSDVYSWLHGDALGYYLYLPATFIHDNLLNINQWPEEAPHVVKEYTGNIALYSGWLGFSKPLNQYTYGVALMEFPFFLVAYLYTLATGGGVTGFESAYLNAIDISAIVFVLLGSILTFKVLRGYFNYLPSLLSVVLIILATHLFWFTIEQAGTSHQPLFFLYAFLVYVSVKIHETGKGKYIIICGFIIGLITLIRPTDILTIIIPLLYGVYNKETLRKKIELVKARVPAILFAVVVFFIPIIPQLLYWKAITGKYLVYSYGNQEFHWTNPQIIKGLFYFSNGWLPYAPMMIFALAGLLLFKKYKAWITVIVIILPVYIYVIYSWYCYNYINGLGSRPMIHLYPLLAIPLAAAIQYLSKCSKVVKISFAAVSVLFIGVIYSLSSLTAKGMLVSEEANAEYYFSVLFKNKISYDDLVVYDIDVCQPDTSELLYIGLLGKLDYNSPDSMTEHIVDDPNSDSDTGYIYHLWNGDDYDNGQGRLEVNYKESMLKDVDWIKCSGDFMYTQPGRRDGKIFIFEVQGRDGSYKSWYGCKIIEKVGLADNSCPHADSFNFFHTETWHWGKVHFYVKVPEGLEKDDIIRLYLWNKDLKETFMDDYVMELFAEK